MVAPVAVENAELFTNGAIAFAAISSDPEALKDTISEGPETLQTGIESLPVQEPFLRDFAEFSRLLRPGVRDLRISLPVLNSAIARGHQGAAADRADEQRPPGRVRRARGARRRAPGLACPTAPTPARPRP